MTARKSYDAIVQSQPFRILRRHLIQEFIRRKPTVRERLAADNSALASERARLIMQDPHATEDQIVKLQSAARHALMTFKDVVAERKRPDVVPSIATLISRSGEART